MRSGPLFPLCEIVSGAGVTGSLNKASRGRAGVLAVSQYRRAVDHDLPPADVPCAGPKDGLANLRWGKTGALPIMEPRRPPGVVVIRDVLPGIFPLSGTARGGYLLY